jgi:hypothetical protein
MEDNLLYLPKSSWSPRFNATFFSFSLDEHQELTEAPKTPNLLGGKRNLPAHYFVLTVFRERQTKTLLRRYSHFKWLFHQITNHPPPYMDSQSTPGVASILRFPAGSCFYQKQDGEFVNHRRQQLRDWLNDVLLRPGYASHPAVKLFFEFSSDDNS